VAILTNGGGPGIMTADACATKGLELPDLSAKTVSGLKKVLSSRASLTNPIDITAEATAEEYSQALKLLAEDDNVDIAIVIFIPPILTQEEAVAASIRKAAPEFRQRGKTLVASFMGSRGASMELHSAEECCVPSFAFPEATATAIAKACEYNDWMKRPTGVIQEMAGIDAQNGKQIVVSALEHSSARPFWLSNDAVVNLLRHYGINMVRSKSAVTVEEAIKAAYELGYPVVMKLISATITHKTEVGGVFLDLRSQKEIEKAFMQIKDHLVNLGRENEMQGVILQQMIPEGVEVIVGVTQDPSFGSLMMFGMGGIYTELFRDVTFRIHPLTDVDAQEMIHSIKAYQLLEGWRGSNPSDIQALEELLLRASALIEDLPQIVELDLNPVKVLEQGKGYVVVDARVMIS